MPTSSRTKPGTQKLSEVARKLVVPSGIVSTEWPGVRDVAVNKFGLRFDRWQDGAGRLILAKRADGKLACMVGGVGMSLPRQVGKTFLIAAIIFALCVLRPGLLVIWSAHHARTHGETFLAMQAFADRARVKPHILKVFTGSGDEEIRFRNGSRILFGARERGFGRGIPGVDVIVSDEAQIMSEKALDAQLATMNVSQFGLAIYVGTPPRPDDPSEAFTRMRTEAWAGELEDTVWIELGAPSGTKVEDWRKVIATVNPSYPHRTPVESILRLKKKLTPESFLREGLGVWDEEKTDGVFDPGVWEACGEDVQTGTLQWLGVAVSVDMKSAAIVGCGTVPDDDRLTVKPLAHGKGIDWVPEVLEEIRTVHDVPAIVDAKGPAAVLLMPLRMIFGKKLHEATTEEVLLACAGFSQAVHQTDLVHGTYPELDAAVKTAAKRDVGDRWAWGRRKSGGDISPLEAATIAHYAAVNVKPHIPVKPDIF